MSKRRTFKVWTWIAVGLLVVVGSSAARKSDSLRKASRTLYVDAYFGDDAYDGLSPFWPLATIQHAIKMAGPWDTVFVYDGIYRESLDLAGKSVSIKGIAGPRGLPIIEATASSAFLMAGGEGPDTVLQNLVIRNSPVGICTLDSSPTLRNLTVVDCGIGLVALRQSAPEITSCIFWNNEADDISGAQARYSCIERIEEDLLFSNINGDPLFVDPVHGDYRLRSGEGYYHMESDTWLMDRLSSPCLNGGDPDTDFSMEPAPNGARLNMGAYGGTAYASLSSNQSPVVTISGPGRASSGGVLYLSVTANAQDPDGQVVKVEFYVDGVKIGEDTDVEDCWFSWEWQVDSERVYTVQIVAEDDQGLRSLSEPSEMAYQGGSSGRGR